MKKQFKIVISKKGFITFYTSYVKTWLGWLKFDASQRGSIYYCWLVDSDIYKSNAEQNITNYCNVKGIFEKDIEIKTIDKR
ncbi:MAG: hypothetical protein WC554_12005 [Clostridia bacterium]|jgi:hypothetical protein